MNYMDLCFQYQHSIFNLVSRCCTCLFRRGAGWRRLLPERAHVHSVQTHFRNPPRRTPGQSPVLAPLLRETGVRYAPRNAVGAAAISHELNHLVLVFTSLVRSIHCSFQNLESQKRGLFVWVSAARRCVLAALSAFAYVTKASTSGWRWIVSVVRVSRSKVSVEFVVQWLYVQSQTA